MTLEELTKCSRGSEQLRSQPLKCERGRGANGNSANAGSPRTAGTLKRYSSRSVELRSFAEELDRKVDLAGNRRPSVLRRHKRKSVD